MSSDRIINIDCVIIQNYPEFDHATIVIPVIGIIQPFTCKICNYHDGYPGLPGAVSSHIMHWSQN